ncbi:cupin-like domain-containing protein [Polyangium aurulentum]|uniref:cupin-like domain-containing protein n=1 Tax=Polyangium aurulentum TaxID=2567896 RepID=UPI00146D10FF|nr:cupin-like domain-containing protein [Polyangium aurulentum]UQA60395.1 cupin-like domain-containing protein [Polyangium aurulentum]
MTIERVSPPAPADFLRDYVIPGRPVVLVGLTDGRAMRERWSLVSLARRFGDRSVAIASARSGVLDGDVRGGVRSESIPFGRYVEMLCAGGHPGLYLVASMEKFFPELRREMEVPIYCRGARWRRSRLFLGAGGSVTPLHRDLAHNLFTQITGRKRFWLYHRADTAWLYSQSFLSGLPNFSRFDPERPEYEQFPHAEAVRPIEVILEEDEVLFLPSLWWHHVRSLELSLSVSCWWTEGPLEVLQRMIERFKRLRGIEL